MPEPSTLVASLFISTVGFALFTYGRKQRRVPHLVSGVGMMGCTFLIDGAAGLWASGVAIALVCWAAVRFGGL